MYGWKLELYLILAEVGGLTRPRPVAKEGLPYFYFAGEKIYPGDVRPVVFNPIFDAVVIEWFFNGMRLWHADSFFRASSFWQGGNISQTAAREQLRKSAIFTTL